MKGGLVNKGAVVIYTCTILCGMSVNKVHVWAYEAKGDTSYVLEKALLWKLIWTPLLTYVPSIACYHSHTITPPFGGFGAYRIAGHLLCSFFLLLNNRHSSYGTFLDYLHATAFRCSLGRPIWHRFLTFLDIQKADGEMLICQHVFLTWPGKARSERPLFIRGPFFCPSGGRSRRNSTRSVNAFFKRGLPSQTLSMQHLSRSAFEWIGAR